MAVLIIQKLGGRRIRMCNANCYNAKHDRCTCICGGANHGVGYDKALENTPVVAQALQAQVSKDGGIQVKLPVIDEPIPTEVYSYGKAEEESKRGDASIPV